MFDVDALSRDELVEKLQELETRRQPFAEAENELKRLEAAYEALRERRRNPPSAEPEPAPKTSLFDKLKGLFGGEASQKQATPQPNLAGDQAVEADLKSRIAIAEGRLGNRQEHVLLEAEITLCRAKINQIDQEEQANRLRALHIEQAEHHRSQQFAQLGRDAAQICVQTAEDLKDVTIREAAAPIPDPQRFQRERELLWLNLQGHHYQVVQIAKELAYDTQLPTELDRPDEATAGNDVMALIEGGVAAATADPIQAILERYQIILGELTARVKHHGAQSEALQQEIDKPYP